MEHRGRYIPNNLIKYRKMHGYKQDEVLALIGMKNTNRLSRWEKGKAMPSAQNLLKLSILYHTLPEQLYDELMADIRRTLSERRELLASIHHQ